MSSLLLLRLLKLSLLMFPLNLTPCSHSCCPPGMTWDTLLTLRGMYLDYVGTLRPSKSYGWGGGVGWVAHKILVTSPEAKFLFPFLGTGISTETWPWACQLLQFVPTYLYIGEVILTQKFIAEKYHLHCTGEGLFISGIPQCDSQKMNNLKKPPLPEVRTYLPVI